MSRQVRPTVFTAEPGSRSQDTLNLLASWAATPGQMSGGRSAADNARHT